MLEAVQYSATGSKQRSKFALPATDFDGTVNDASLHASVRAYLNNQRQGTHKTKTRAEVTGGSAKPWRQKGTGRARAGTTRAAQWRGGGIVFGPRPRSYRTDIPRKMRQLARRSALNARARENALLVIEPLAFEAPKTTQLAEVLANVGVIDRKVLLLTNGANSAVYLSGRNMPGVQVLPYAEASAYDILWSDVVVVEETALGQAGEVVEPPTAEAEAPKAKVTVKKAAKKTTRKPATKKAAKKAAKKVAKKAAKKTKAKKTTAKKATAKKATKKKGGK
jgi:large subunit ribosomal protein L4